MNASLHITWNSVACYSAFYAYTLAVNSIIHINLIYHQCRIYYIKFTFTFQLPKLLKTIAGCRLSFVEGIEGIGEESHGKQGNFSPWSTSEAH